MTTKANKRAAMKRAAHAMAAINGALALSKVYIDTREMHPLLRATAVRTVAGVWKRKAENIAQTPAHLFRTDRPQLDPRRVARDRRKQGGVMVSVNVDRGQIGGDWTARQIIEVINQEAKKP